MACLLNVLNHRDDTFCTIIDNFSKNKETHEILNNTHHDRLTVIKNQINNGKAIATNAYLSETLTSKNCPRILVSMDPDVVFDTQSFNYFISALDSIPNLGMLAMRYIDNGFNPERSVWWPSKQIKGKGAAFNIRRPVFANVPGGFFGIQGYILNYYLNFKLFPKTKNEENIKK
jgi:GT2 family glycosyltransferase